MTGSIGNNQDSYKFSGNLNDSGNFVVTVQWGDKIRTLAPLEIKIGDKKLSDKHDAHFEEVAEQVYKLYETWIKEKWDEGTGPIDLEYGFTGKLNKAENETDQKVSEVTKKFIGNDSTEESESPTDGQIKAIDKIARSILGPGVQSGSEETKEGAADIPVGTNQKADTADTADTLTEAGEVDTPVDSRPKVSKEEINTVANAFVEGVTEEAVTEQTNKLATVNHAERTLAPKNQPEEQKDGTESTARELQTDRTQLVQTEGTEEDEEEEGQVDTNPLAQTGTNPTAAPKRRDTPLEDLDRSSTPRFTISPVVQETNHAAAEETREQTPQQTAEDTPVADTEEERTAPKADKSLVAQARETAQEEAPTIFTFTPAPSDNSSIDSASAKADTNLKAQNLTSSTPNNGTAETANEVAKNLFSTTPGSLSPTETQASEKALLEAFDRITTSETYSNNKTPINRRKVTQKTIPKSIKESSSSAPNSPKDNQTNSRTFTPSTRRMSSSDSIRPKLQGLPLTESRKIADANKAERLGRNEKLNQQAKGIKNPSSSATTTPTVNKTPSRASTPSTGRTSSSDSRKTPLKGLSLKERRKLAEEKNNAGTKRHKELIERGRKERKKILEDQNTASTDSTPSTSRTDGTNSTRTKLTGLSYGDRVKAAQKKQKKVTGRNEELKKLAKPTNDKIRGKLNNKKPNPS